MNDYDETAVDYVADGHEPPIMDMTGESLAGEEYDDRGDLGNSNPHQVENGASEKDSVEEIAKYQPLPRRLGRVRKKPVWSLNIVMMPAEDLITYKKVLKSS